ncbi:hypothetical protein [Streptomyces africanus]|uniref:hypothetical protein n=1 Tax=Streptomyces africanus TaxID=231024 RepID=UPI000A3A29BD|nr:hypothetical protein [Streptomyces africanus]
MATGPEHYREAERLIEQSKTWANADTGWKAHLSPEVRRAYRMADLAEAQVHADLAKAAATAMGALSGGMAGEDYSAWDKVAGEH